MSENLYPDGSEVVPSGSAVAWLVVFLALELVCGISTLLYVLANYVP